MTSEQPAHDIDQGIDGPHFMKRNSGGIVSMHRSFCRGQAFEDRKRLFFDAEEVTGSWTEAAGFAARSGVFPRPWE